MLLLSDPTSPMTMSSAEDGDEVGDLVADAHLLEGGQVDEAWRAHVVAVGIGLAVGDDVESQARPLGYSMRP